MGFHGGEEKRGRWDGDGEERWGGQMERRGRVRGDERG